MEARHHDAGSNHAPGCIHDTADATEDYTYFALDSQEELSASAREHKVPTTLARRGALSADARRERSLVRADGSRGRFARAIRADGSRDRPPPPFATGGRTRRAEAAFALFGRIPRPNARIFSMM